jgi:hypothetical protein
MTSLFEGFSALIGYGLLKSFISVKGLFEGCLRVWFRVCVGGISKVFRVVLKAVRDVTGV